MTSNRNWIVRARRLACVEQREPQPILFIHTHTDTAFHPPLCWNIWGNDARGNRSRPVFSTFCIRSAYCCCCCCFWNQSLLLRCFRSIDCWRFQIYPQKIYKEIYNEHSSVGAFKNLRQKLKLHHWDHFFLLFCGTRRTGKNSVLTKSSLLYSRLSKFNEKFSHCTMACSHQYLGAQMENSYHEH